MYKRAAITIALLAALEPSAAYDKPVTLRRLHHEERQLNSASPVAVASTLAPVVSVPVYIPIKTAKSAKKAAKNAQSAKTGKRQLAHYKAPYEN